MSTAEQIYVPRKIWTRSEARGLADSGLFAPAKLELINGELIDKMGKNPPHVFWLTVFRNCLISNFGAEFVRTESPIDVAPDELLKNEPEPDLSVTRHSIFSNADNPKPEELKLVIEISDTTLPYDLNIKGPLYARAGIREYWVLDVNERKLIVHREPQDGLYQWKRIFLSAEEFDLNGALETLEKLACDRGN